jgi:hypothetical protein
MPEVPRLSMYEDKLRHTAYFSIYVLISEEFKRCVIVPVAGAIRLSSIFVAIRYVKLL